MTVTSSPCLKFVNGSLYSARVADKRIPPHRVWEMLWLCRTYLGRHFEIPPARCYWLEFSDKQWPDRSGVAVQVKMCRGMAQYFGLSRWIAMPKIWDAVGSKLSIGEKPTRMFWRLMGGE